jgi:hypothetical protein
MFRLTLIHGDQEIEMPLGESFVGRGLACQLRFNDAAVSRRHLRVICSHEGAFVENLSRTNGTLINRVRLTKTVRLEHGDSLTIGHRTLGVQIDDRRRDTESGPVTITGPVEIGPGLLIAEDLLDKSYGDETRPGTGPASLLAGIAAPQERNCPKCRAKVARRELHCHSCGYRWPFGGVGSPTQEIKLADLPGRIERRERRHVIRVPVIYSSEYLTLDCMARDLSRGGMFVASELLDPVGTWCELTALPDGRAAVSFEAEVCHVSTEIVAGRPPGFGVRFESMSDDAKDWLELVTSRKD